MKHPLPDKFKTRMQGILGNDADDFFAVLDADHRPTSVMVGHQATTDSFILPIKQSVPWSNGLGHYLQHRPQFVFDPLIHAGAYYVQEASSMFINHLAKQALQSAKNKPKIALDLCAAPGGKSIGLRQTLDPTTLLISNEMVGKRNQILAENLEKQGFDNCVVTCLKSSQLAQSVRADLIILDAPCSGEGMFRKDNDARKQWNEQLLNNCEKVQEQLIQDSDEMLNENGTLIYSTCTFNPNENEEQIKKLLNTGDYIGYKVKLNADWNITEIEIKSEETGTTAYGYYFFPHKTEGEGLFACALQKVYPNSSKIRKSGDRFWRPAKMANYPTLNQLLNPNSELAFFSTKTQIACIANQHSDIVATLTEQIPLVRPGITIAEIGKAGLVELHGLLTSHHHNPNLPKLTLNLNQTLEYLQRKPVYLDIEKQLVGRVIVTYNNWYIGWGKISNGRLNSAYPSYYKLRKDPELME